MHPLFKHTHHPIHTSAWLLAKNVTLDVKLSEYTNINPAAVEPTDSALSTMARDTTDATTAPSVYIDRYKDS